MEKFWRKIGYFLKTKKHRTEIPYKMTCCTAPHLSWRPLSRAKDIFVFYMFLEQIYADLGEQLKDFWRISENSLKIFGEMLKIFQRTLDKI